MVRGGPASDPPAGHLFVADSSPKVLAELTPSGGLVRSWNRYVSQLAAGRHGTIVVADYGFSLDRIRAGRLRTIVAFRLDSLPGLSGAFRPSGIAVGRDGTIYADTDGINGGTDRPALLELRPGHGARLLPTTG